MSKLMSILIKQTLFCIFILMIPGLFLTCDDPSSPFSNNQGEKVVVEPPTIFNITPVSGSFLNGTITFTATAKAYIKVERVEVYIYEDEENGQREVKWTDSGIRLSGSVKLKQMSYEFDTLKHNNWDFGKKEQTAPKDGPIRMKFRIYDSAGIDRNGKPIPGKAIESIQLVYIIKNNPSDIKMAYPSDTEIFTMTFSDEEEITGKTELPKIQFQGEIRGSITDRRGIRPGFPQIKLWPYKDDNGNVMPEPDGKDPKWGWATLFLSCDDMEKEGPSRPGGVAGPGYYEDRSKIRVLNYTSFGLRMAEYTIVPDPVNPDVRKVQYRVGNASDTDDGNKFIGQHVPFKSGNVYNFRIRTRDVEPDLSNGAIPSADPDPIDPNNPPWIEGFYPPFDFRTPNEDRTVRRKEPVRIRIQSAGAPPIVEINNDDAEGDLKKTPNKFITDYTSYKIEQTGFRLRLFVTFEENGGLDIEDTILEWKESSGRGVIIDPIQGAIGTRLYWDPPNPSNSPHLPPYPGLDLGDPANTAGKGIVTDYINTEGRKGTLFTYTSTVDPNGPSIFKDSPGYYTLIFKVKVTGEPEIREYPFTVYIDGTNPDVKIRYIHGAADRKAPPLSAAVAYTVNGNIQAVVDGTDARGIMTFMQDSDMGEFPYDDMGKPLDRNNVDNGRPMIKWIIEQADISESAPSDTGNTIRAKLKAYKDNPTNENLKFFKDIQETQTHVITLFPSGWVKRELPKKPGQIEANEFPNFKLNTTSLPDGYYWLYVIAMDQVQNLGFVARKIYVDQSSDKPVPVIRPLSEENPLGTPINNEKDLDVTVTIEATGSGNNVKRKIEGNWSGTGEDVTKGKRNNILGRNDKIGLNFTDDDGISLDKGGVTIKLTDLNTPRAANSPVTFSNATADDLKLLKEIINSGDNKDMSGTLSQEIMAKALYGPAHEGGLKDGVYQIDITVKDDIDQKVALTLPQYPGTNPGDTPKVAPDPPETKTYYFAVSTDLPEIIITYPDDNALGSSKPIDIYGTVKSRLNVQNLYITFTPDIITPSTANLSSSPIPPLTLYTDAAYTIPAPADRTQAAPDADGYYTYYWIKKNVVFEPSGVTFSNDLRNYTVEAYDRLGNLSKVDRTVQIDKSGLTLELTEFNYNRPADSDDKLSVYGKVSFKISASGPNGLYDANGSAGIKWWVLPASAAAPSWNTDPTEYTKTDPNFTLTPDKWKGGGEFLLSQARSGGTYTGVIDTRYLTDKTAEYKLYYMVMGKAGNTEMKTVLPPDYVIDSFWIDQSKDYPTIYENTLNPLPNSVVGKTDTTLTISGTVSDADLFNPAKLSTTPNALGNTYYVQIRYPSSTSSAGVPTWTNNWINIPIPPKYTSAAGGIDAAGDIVYKFDTSTNAGAQTYFSGDGIKYYQIRVTDEPDGPTDAEKAAGAKWYGKNPDLFMTTPPDSANYPGYIYQKHDRVSKIFPLDDKKAATDPEAYIFFVDNTPPEIYFNLYDPTAGHENYAKNADGTPALRPTFSKWTQLKDALNNLPSKNGKGNYVKEYKLIDLTLTWSAGNELFTKVIVDNPDNPSIAGEYPWDLSASPTGTWTADDDTKLQKIFNAAPQGLQVLAFEATDMIPYTGRASWIFAKDTQGPDIIFNTINRAIKRAHIPPAATDFPSNWPTNVTEWNSAWDSVSWNSVTWKNIITNWPSEYAFKEAADVIIALKKENDLSKTPSTVIGDDNTPAVIQGSFTDEFSSIIQVVPATAETYFYYRFKDKTGKLQEIPNISGLVAAPVTLAPIGFTDPTISPDNRWIQKQVKKGKSDKEAEWEIILNEANGFKGTDGENWLDIRVADTAGNISEIYNVIFLLDRAPPLLGDYDSYVTPPTASLPIKPGEFRISKLNGVAQTPSLSLPEDQRVISAAGGAGTGNVFSVTGRVNDYNLSNLRITLGQDGTTAYTVTASADIDLLKSSANPPTGTGNGVTITDDKLANDLPDTGVQRLTLNGPYIAGTTTFYTSTSTGTPEWEWTFEILAKDAAGLRAAAGTNADSTRRYIRVTASDKAGKREGPVEWSFYLDTKKPIIEYTNLDKGRAGSSFESDVKLSVLVSDDTKIKDVKYIIGRWKYSTPQEWEWYVNGSWTTPQPAVDDWPKVFTDDTARQTTMDFNITKAMLNDAGTTKFPTDLFDQEGQYRLDLYVTDYSLGNGNAHNTTEGNNDEPSVSDNGFKDFGYNATAGTGSASARVFYIDKKDPTLRWASSIEDKLYFRNEDSGTDKGKVIFGFIAGDGNTLQSWKAEVRQGVDLVTNGTIIWQSEWSGLTTPAVMDISPAIPVPETVAPTSTTPEKDKTTPATTAGHKIFETSINEQYFEIKPFMTRNADTNNNEALDVGIDPLPIYTITITVADGAKRTNSITKTFTLDNTPPKFVQEKYLPLSYKYKNVTEPADPDVISVTPDVKRYYSYDAISGKLNIRGNTTDNSNQIKSIAYYVVNSDESTAWTKFPTPEWVTSNNKWRYSGGEGGNAPEIKTSGGTTLIQIDEGTFAWTIMMPQTSLFLTTDATAVNNRQKAQTGGKSIKGEDKTATDYYDVDPAALLSASPGTLSVTPANPTVPTLRFPDLNNGYSPANPTAIYGGEDVCLITVYVRAEDAAGNVKYDVLKYWIWPEGDRPIVTQINNPDSSKIAAERLLNGTIRLSGMAKDNERVKYVWFRVLDAVTGVPYGTGALASKPLTIPKWQDTDKTTGNPIGGNWDEAGGTQTAVDGSTIGSRRTDDPWTTPEPGWYMANGGHSRDVSWWAYINTNGELDPTGTEESKEFIVEVRAQDVTYDEKNDKWMEYDPVNPGYRGMASAMTTVSRVNAWVVAGAPIFEKVFVASGNSVDAEAAEATANRIWTSIDNLHLRNRSAYKVTVKHNSGLSSIRWSPTFWDRSLNASAGAFQANPRLETLNLFDLNTSSATNPEYFYVYRTGSEPTTGTNNLGSSYKTQKANRNDFWTTMNNLSSKTDATPRMALTVKPKSMLGPGSAVPLNKDRKYMVWKWDIALETSGAFPHMDGTNHDPTHIDKDNNHKDMKNSVFSPPTTKSYDIGTAILIESEPEDSSQYFKWDIFVDVRADLLLADMTKDDTNYGKRTLTGRDGQYENSVRYPLYLSASEVSKATPLTSRGDALLPIDNLPPYGMYTLNRKPAGTAVTIGGEAGDDGPVKGIARVVLWFQKKDSTVGVSWHDQDPQPETSLPHGTFIAYTSGGPTWWQEVNLTEFTGATKPALGIAGSSTGGDSAIVIDKDSPSKGNGAWGHSLPMGFADGGLSKIWYVEINSYGLESGPIDLHYVIIDKAGNYKYYKERLVIMNGVAVIDRVKLATDIRHSSWTGTNLAGNNGLTAGVKIDDKAASSAPSLWPILKDVRSKALNSGADTDLKNDVKKGISDWISAGALGANRVIDFNVRNNLFALRVETTNKPGTNKTRNFRLEYVAGARLMTSDTPGTGQGRLTDIEAGRVYIINNPGTARWGTFGAEGDESAWKRRGYAFIATVSGKDLDDLAKANLGTGSAWELNPQTLGSQTLGYPAIGERTGINNTALRLADAKYTTTADPTAYSAEFAYANSAFTNGIVDSSGPVDTVFPPPPNAAYTDWTTWNNASWSLFILRVFDGPEADIFGDFTILRVRVNNDDKTPPFAQLYDVNPKTEGQERANIAGDSQTVEVRRSVSPMFIGEGAGSNRTKGGLWNDSDKLGSVEKPGHIEPRRTGNAAPYTHSLTSAQMGGAATEGDATITKPFANPAGFFMTDTVSGKVVLRGYAEDDQRVHRVRLVIGGENIDILDYPSGGTGAGNPADNSTYTSPKTGLLSIPQAQSSKVYYTDSIDLYRHRVEWAYIWDTETIPANTVVGNGISVRVISYPRDGASGTTPKAAGSAEITIANGKPHVDTPDPNDSIEATRPNSKPFNPGFPVGLIKYNSITVNLRPYITGFLRNRTLFSHDTRSRQGRYMFARNETAVVKGFNLAPSAGGNVGSISINGTGITTSNVGSTGGTSIGDFGIATASNNHYRQFTVGTGVTTGNGLVTYTYSSRDAVNTGSERAKTTTAGTTNPYVPPTTRPNYIQPWNIEYSPGVDGSTLWDDFTQLHIWQSNDNAPGGNNDTAANASGRFYSRDNGLIFNPAMSMDPRTALLYESHNESGSGGNGWYNTGTTKKSGINNNSNETVTQFADPIFFSDVYRSPGNGTDATSAGTWAVSSIIGRSSSYQYWRALGGVYINGLGGTGVAFCGGGTGSTDTNPSNQSDVYSSSLYHGESAWYNSSDGNQNTAPGGRLTNSTDQFMNPRIVTSYDGGREHIHVSYYDEKDGSIKYRYNLRGTPGKIDGGAGTNQQAVNDNNAIPKQWTNLDGGLDLEDTDQSTYTTGGNIAENARVVGWTSSIAATKTARGNVNAGKHNSIAVTSGGYPVVAYYASDQTGQRLKLAVSNRVDPVLASAWRIYDNISSFGTGEFVSMKIDTKASTNVVHIAAMNTNKRLVYITFTLTVASGGTPALGIRTEQVVDSVGNVGRWCALSLDERGNPWISYMDESWVGARDGAKVAYKDADTFYKGRTYRPTEDKDVNGENISGWEAMHVPTLHRVANPIEGNGREHGRLGMECFPARNYPPNNNVTRFWSGAVGYLSQDAETNTNGNTQGAAPMDRYRIAYYVK